MFCKKCGKAVKEGSKFCLNCGSPMPETPIASAAPPFPIIYPPAPNEAEPEKKKGAGSFFSSAPGIALIVILGLAVIAGITFGIIFLVKGNANNTVDAETVKVWDEYESILEDNSADVAQINMDPNALTKTQEDLKKTQERVAALEKVLAKTGGTQQRRVNKNVKPANTRDIKAEQMAAAITAYNEYVKKMDQFFGALIGAITGNQLSNPDVVNSLNAILAELQKLAADVKTLAGKFLKDNNKVNVANFDPPVLVFAKSITPQVEQKVAEAQAAEAARLEAERVAAEQAAAAEAERQRQAAAAAERQQAEDASQDTTDDWTCGDPSCPI